MDLTKQLNQVHDEASFLEFVRALKANRDADDVASVDAFGRGEKGWENHSISDFLGAALAWAEASNFGLNQGLDDSNLWKRFAVFLHCGKIYE